jgi:hypothetical protein
VETALGTGWLIALIIASPTLLGALYGVARLVARVWRSQAEAERKVRMKVEADRDLLEKKLEEKIAELHRAELEKMFMQKQVEWLERDLQRSSGRLRGETESWGQ